MSHKGRDKNSSSPGEVVTKSAQIRNVAIVGHVGVGKTTLVEELLRSTGGIERSGTIAGGNTVCDYDSAAITQQRSVGLACAPIESQNIKINLVDTPGYADFVGELRAGLRATDAALFVVSAVNGLDVATQQLWHECAAVGMPRAIAVTRLDHPQADFDETVALCQRMFGEGVLPAYLPLFGDDGSSVDGLIGLVTQRVFDYTAGHPAKVQQAAPEHMTATEDARAALIEGIIAESEDETLMERYIAGETIDHSTLIADLEAAVARGAFYPVVPVNATTQIGLDAVLELIRGGFPSPLERSAPVVTTIDGEAVAPLYCEPQERLAAEVVKTSVDSYVGRVSVVRVFSGTLKGDTAVHIGGHGLATRGRPDHDADERITHLYTPLGASLREISECGPGDICAITKSGSAETGDTISEKDTPLLMEPWSMPEPLLPIAIVAPSRADEDAMAKNLARLVAADPTLRLERNPETHQIVLWCMGESHAEVALERLRNGGTQVDVEAMRIALRETFTTSAKGTGRHVKQSGGHGQYAICHIEVEPLPQGAGFEFVDKIVGGAIPRQFILSVEKGVKAQMERGLSSSHPVVDLKVSLHDGKTHSVDSSDAAFQAAGALALRDAADHAQLSLLEPADEVTITVAEGYVGAVMSDLSTRRAKVLGTETDAQNAVVRAEIPASELLRYAIELRAMTAGSGSFTRTFARYEPLPKQLSSEFGSQSPS